MEQQWLFILDRKKSKLFNSNLSFSNIFLLQYQKYKFLNISWIYIIYRTSRAATQISAAVISSNGAKETAVTEEP